MYEWRNPGTDFTKRPANCACHDGAKEVLGLLLNAAAAFLTKKKIYRKTTTLEVSKNNNSFIVGELRPEERVLNSESWVKNRAKLRNLFGQAGYLPFTQVPTWKIEMGNYINKKVNVKVWRKERWNSGKLFNEARKERKWLTDWRTYRFDLTCWSDWAAGRLSEDWFIPYG